MMNQIPKTVLNFLQPLGHRANFIPWRPQFFWRRPTIATKQTPRD